MLLLQRVDERQVRGRGFADAHAQRGMTRIWVDMVETPHDNPQPTPLEHAPQEPRRLATNVLLVLIMTCVVIALLGCIALLILNYVFPNW